MSPHAGTISGRLLETEHGHDKNEKNVVDLGLANISVPSIPSLGGIPLKYLSLATLAVQNSMLTIIMHYSRISTPPSKAYSAATAVLLNELLKGAISFAIAFARLSPPSTPRNIDIFQPPHQWPHRIFGDIFGSTMCTRVFFMRTKKIANEVFSPDCWKLSIPAILYVIQNHLQFIAISNLDAATFQVSYQMKILTTAAFSVLLLRKKLLSSQWIALFLLAIGVGIVQIQSNAAGAHDYKPVKPHAMNPVAGLLAVAAACFTSGLAGVYFEMVLKNSQCDIWVRNIQLSLFSLLPALSPLVLAHVRSYGTGGTRGGSITSLFDNFGPWAWATVAIQVIGGLLTALVIKYSDNILKGFATSLSILISFLASVALFDFRLTFNFLTGSLLVVFATWLYNQRQVRAGCRGNKGEIGLGHLNWKDPVVTLCCRSQDEIDSPMSTSPTFSMKSEKAWEQDQKLHFFNSQTGAA